MQTTTNPSQLFGCDVLDSEGNKIGSVDNVWVDDATNELEFIGVKTGWLMGKTHVIPTNNAQVSDGAITVPYAESQIKDAPGYSGDQEISPEQEDEVYSYYGVDRSTAQSPTGLPSGGTGTGYTGTDTGADFGDDRTASYADTGTARTEGDEQAGMTLSEEELQVGKRQVEAGKVRLRKVVRTEHQEVPVDLQREEVEIERVPAGEAGGAPSDAFQEGEVEVPVMREEAVVGKEARVTGGVRLNKGVTTETQNVGDEVRKEDVEIDRDVDSEVTSRDRQF